MMIAITIALRNLWRNPRRTLLNASGIGFAVLLMVFAYSMQTGTFSVMVDNLCRLSTGHVQIQVPGYQDDPRLRSTLVGVDALRRQVEKLPGVQVAALRASSFALVSSAEDRTFGAMVTGVEPARERIGSTLPRRVSTGRYIEDGSEAVIGSALGRNLGIGVGDELVVLGSAKQGGVAALVLEVVGIVETLQPEMDRTLVHVPMTVFREGFGLGDEAHAVVITGNDVDMAFAIADRVSETVGREGVTVLAWNELMPGVEEAIEFKRVGSNFMFALLVALVTFAVVNTFMMVVFERGQEFGMLLALGNRPRWIVSMLQLEAAALALLGIAAGLVVAVALVLWLEGVGIPLPEGAADALEQFQMPSRMYPTLTWAPVIVASVVMLLATQLAAFFPALKVLRIEPTEALRPAS